MIPDPIELMEARAERMIDKHFPADKPGQFLCAVCAQWLPDSVGCEGLDADPASPPVCWPCADKLRGKS